ncbi:putative nucleotidyltransferase with HDIG domain [Deinococcus metalli]|uniref:Phosphohydrolase n=1 Tax=Deinococcus metalli TaxID=1141878 RepID=A0A7W8KIY2_9DEIO|nr:HD domain-containing phosphohydrolase [Deinococcus metalli]MBB5377384.1 putative nucleotidyltransferase with HDIG domain [Deinococcus metalli]GHF50021.1 phosphohydrolase [Deinococcus metalli]
MTTRPGDEVPQLTLELARLGLSAQDLGSAMQPVLDTLVARTAAVGAGYFQWRDHTLTFAARAGSGHMPQGSVMAALLAHGLPSDLPLMAALQNAPGVLFIEDTRQDSATAGFPELGVLALVAAPVRSRGGELVGALLAHAFTPHAWTPDERALISHVTSLLSLLAARLDAEERERAAQEDALRALGVCLEARDAETLGHTDRVTALATSLGKRLGLRGPALRALRWGAYLHDIGKIAVPDAILGHPGPLPGEMWQRMQAHVQDGLHLAQQLPFLPQSALDVIAYHHERWDGAGYPFGRQGEDIPLLARIFAVCDVYDALRHVRPYKPAWSLDDTLAEIREGRGTHFDPQVVDALLDVLDEAGALA